jgi:hypothetical protein
MNSPLDWLRRQSWIARGILSGAFVAITAVGYFWADRLWPWGIFMSVAPWLVGKRASEEEDFFRPVKETGENPIAAVRVEIRDEVVDSLLADLAAKTTSGLSPDKINAVVESLPSLSEGQEKRFQYVVMFAAKPTSLQIVARRKQPAVVEIEVLSDVRLATALGKLGAVASG